MASGRFSFFAAALLCVTARAGAVDFLQSFSGSVQTLTRKVSPSVVKIVVTRYGPKQDGGSNRTDLVVGHQQSIGSGFVWDADGYIVTNAHVVANAQKIRVSFATESDEPMAAALADVYAPMRDASLVGVFKEGDLALLKIEGGGKLPMLRLADYSKLRQGQVVFAMGSPEGLPNSISMGVVSSVARQPDVDTPFVYVQTDAPINPGNSGGPLVNTAGEVVGVNTFIMTQSGGSEGVNFAIPSSLIQTVAGQLKKYGHVHRPMIGVGVQTITTQMAAALRLGRTKGVMVSDVLPDSPAANAGVKLEDIILTVNEKPAANLPMFMADLFESAESKHVQLTVLRSGETLTMDVPTMSDEHTGMDDLASSIDPKQNLIPQLGVLGATVDKGMGSAVANLRIDHGVVVLARGETSSTVTGLQTGDVIHEVNGSMVTSMNQLREAMQQMKAGDDVALFIERDKKLQYVAFELE